MPTFTWIDWLVVFGYLGLTTLVGHRLRGTQSSIRDFFLAGRRLPWPAVTGSIIATEISGVTFIGVPGMLFALQGNFTYLQWAIGSIIARILIAAFIVPIYYRQEIYSPYDYMGRQLGSGAKTLATVLFTLGSILGQSVRVLVAAIPLRVATNMDMHWCILIIGLFAIGWTLMGGMQTVIWTDVMQFFLFAVGGVVALFMLVGGIHGGWTGLLATAEDFGRLKFLDTRFEADLQFTLWVALLAVPFQNLTAFGVDQLNAQRMFCCRDARSAGKALIFSSVGQLLTLLMLLVGAALFVHYHQNPMGAEARGLLEAGSGTIGDSRVPDIPGKHRDAVFPLWIVTSLPEGARGLLLAGVFAAAISSLDSILAALSQTTLSLIYHPERKTDEELASLNLLAKSRWLVVAWGVGLTGFTLLLMAIRENIPILPLAFGMTSYTMGPLLALLVSSILGKASMRGLAVGASLSILLVAFVRTDLWVLWIKAGAPWQWLASLPTYTLNADGTSVTSTISYVWAWPVTAILTFACGQAGRWIKPRNAP